jgi:L-lactate dehydrogenase complex protein LldG
VKIFLNSEIRAIFTFYFLLFDSMKKEDFLKRISTALHRKEGAPVEVPPLLLEPLESWNSSELVEGFKLEHETVGGLFRLVQTMEEMRVTLKSVLAELGAKSFICSTDGIVDEVLSAVNLPLAENPADADVGITGVRCAIAQTGTLVLTSDAGRKASLLPMNHIALIRTEQLVPTMAEAFELHLSKPSMDIPTAWVQATGPSRTADIEQTLEIGVHGPGVVHVILIQ